MDAGTRARVPPPPPARGTIRTVPILRLFASAREAAGTGTEVIDGITVGEVLDRAVERHGPDFASVLATCRVWLNGDAAERTTPVSASDEVAILPPVSGGTQ